MAKITDRYATALYKISEEKSTLESDLQDANFIKDSLNSDDVRAFLVHPSIPNSAKNELFKNAFSEKVNEHMIGLLYLMVRRNREKLIIPALTKYIELVNRYFGRIEAKVVSAKPITKEQLDYIKELLLNKTDMEVDLKTIVDPDVIGGFYILVDGYVFDASVRNRLNNMKDRFYEGRVIARVVTAKPLSQQQIKSIDNILSSKINKLVEIKVVIEPELLGGFYVVVDGQVFDATVSSRLKDMNKRLKREENLNGK